MSEQVAWMQNEELFKQQLLIGVEWQYRVAEYLLRQNITVYVPKATFRKDTSEIGQYADQVDLYAAGLPIEVKSSKRTFTGTHDVFKPLIVCSKSSFDQLKKPPYAFITISRETQAMVVVRSHSYPNWVVRRFEDKKRGITDHFYVVNDPYIYSIDRLVDYLQRKMEWSGVA
mgnify:CR=1 FL=1